MFRPKKPITQTSGEYYEDTLENFLKKRPIKKQNETTTDTSHTGYNTNGKRPNEID